MLVSSNTCEWSVNISGYRKKNTQISCRAGKELVVALTTFRIFLACTKIVVCSCVESFYMGVSKNRGTPKWMVYNGKPYVLMDDLGGKPTIFSSFCAISDLKCTLYTASVKKKT